MINRGENESRGKTTVREFTEIFSQAGGDQQFRPPTLGESQGKTGNSQPDKRYSENDMLPDFRNCHSDNRGFAHVLATGFLHRVDVDQ